MATQEDFEAALGRISIQFARLDFLLTNILCWLIGGRNAVVGTVLADRLPLSVKIEHIRHLAEFRLEDPSDRAELPSLLNAVKPVLRTRNDLIHGLWDLGPEAMSQGYVKVVSLRWKDLKGPGPWEHFPQETTYNLAKLHDVAEKLRKLTEWAAGFQDRLGRAKIEGINIGPLDPQGEGPS